MIQQMMVTSEDCFKLRPAVFLAGALLSEQMMVTSEELQGK
jgi:hypothetical protein